MSNESTGKSIFQLAVLLAQGASFIGAIVCLFSGAFLGAIGLFVLAAVLSGVLKGTGI